jgi:hypothetical protein
LALSADTWAVPSKYTMRPFFCQTETVVSQTALDETRSAAALDGKHTTTAAAEPIKCWIHWRRLAVWCVVTTESSGDAIWRTTDRLVVEVEIGDHASTDC